LQTFNRELDPCLSVRLNANVFNIYRLPNNQTMTFFLPTAIMILQLGGKILLFFKKNKKIYPEILIILHGYNIQADDNPSNYP
jgi:hypothetical protein